MSAVAGCSDPMLGIAVTVEVHHALKAAWSSFDMDPRKSSSASEKALLAADGA